MTGPGQLAIVLHTHMPYVEGGAEWPPQDPPSFLRSPQGFGTWPFGEEWLWEAIATSYLPLLDVLGRAPVTLSLTPVLCDQLQDTDALARCQSFLDEVRPESHRLDIEHFRGKGEPGVAGSLEQSAADYASAAERLREVRERPGGLLGALGRHVSWTSSATHAVLPLLASDGGIALQVQSGIASHRQRFGEWAGGFWLPECAYAPWLDEHLEEAGVRSACVELTRRLGVGDERHLRPLRTQAGPVLWPIDRATIARVWSPAGYPSRPVYRSYHAQTPRRHRAWANDGAPYDPKAALAAAGCDAAEFVAAVSERVRAGGVCVCALDTELLGHWWHEGVRWLGSVLDEAARQGLELTTLDEALERHEPQPAPDGLDVSSWGDGGDLRTWSAPPVADLAWLARTAELQTLASAGRPPDRALRELLALQASDWAFQITHQLAGEYPRERARAHAEALHAALDGEDLDQRLRNMAPDLVGWS
ncbi:MAG: 1,4-alpha-glucan branching protein domain-containing protein [Solirubrobacteraceae bacterium]